MVAPLRLSVHELAPELGVTPSPELRAAHPVYSALGATYTVPPSGTTSRSDWT